MLHLLIWNSWSLLYLCQMAFTVWMLVDAHRRGVEYYWFFLIFMLQPFGSWVYFLLFKVKDFQTDRGWLVSLFHRPPALDELRRRAQRSGTVASRLELGSRLAETGEFEEAIPHLEAVLGHEPEHCEALYSLAIARRGLSQFSMAVPPLRKIIARHPTWSNYKAWHTLVAVQEAGGEKEQALSTCRELARVAPSTQHGYLLAQQLIAHGKNDEARQVLEQKLEDYRYMTGFSRRVARRWVGKSKQLLKQID